MISLLSWLFPRKNGHPVLAALDQQIENKQIAIEARDKGIEAVQPIVEEAIKQTDDVYYKLRHEVGRAARRKEKTEKDTFIKDIEIGWRRE